MKQENRLESHIYVNLSKPLKFKEFEELKSPMGWIRIDLLKKKLKENKKFKEKFSPPEIRLITLKGGKKQ